MNISTNSIVTNYDMIEKYKACRKKAEKSGQVLIMKNNEVDAVLFSTKEYEKIAPFIELMERLEGKYITNRNLDNVSLKKNDTQDFTHGGKQDDHSKPKQQALRKDKLRLMGQ